MKYSLWSLMMRFRFSIRAMFVVMTAIGLVLLPVALRVHRLQQQRAAVNAVKQLQGFFGTTENPEELTHVYFLNNLNDKQVAEIVPHLRQFPKLKWLEIHSWRMTDKSAKHLGELSTLEILILSDAPLTDASVMQLGQLSGLKTLALQGDHLTDNGLTELWKLRNLETFATSSSAVTDKGIRQLASLPKLRQLNLDGTKVTDVGLKELSSLRTGTFFVLSNSSPNPRVYSH